MESEAYVYALLLTKMPVMYCLPCAARDHFVLTINVYWNKTQQRTVLMAANKDPVGYEGHIKSLKTALKKADYRIVLCRASMAYAKHHYLYPQDPRIPVFIQLFQADVYKVGANGVQSDLEFKALTSSESLTKMTVDGIKKLKHIKPLNLDRINQQLHSAGEASKLLKDAIKSFTEEASRYNYDVHSGVARGPAPTLALKAAAGIGKTMGIINNCIGIDALKGSIDYYVPSDVLGNQVIDDLKYNLLGLGKDPNQSPPFDSEAVTFRAIRGRSKADEDGNPLCLDIASVDKAKSLGMSIQKNICTHCDHFTDCGYQKQFKHVELPKLDQPIIITEELIQIDDWDIPPAVNDDGTPFAVRKAIKSS